MSSATNGISLAPDDAEGIRHRQYQDLAQLLKEYTGVMYEIAYKIGAHLDTEKEQSNRNFPWSIFLGLERYGSVWRPMRDAALFASQMLVHYQLDEAEAAELRLRVADAECSILTTALLINNILRKHHPDLVNPIPTEELDAFLNQIRKTLKG